MHNLLGFGLFVSLALSSCATKQLVAIADKTDEQIRTNYQVTKDVAYGADPEQTMDVYVSRAAKALGRKNFTIVFLHGGGYYLSDKSKEERYIRPYLKKGLNVVNLNYRIKRGVPVATEDLPTALNYLLTQQAAYPLNLGRVVPTGFSAGAHIASLAAVTANDPAYPNKLAPGIKIAAVINFSGPVDGLDVVEQVFTNNEEPIMKAIGVALFPAADYAPKEFVAKYEPITYFDKNDPPFFLWQGGQDDQVPARTFEKFVGLLNQDPNKNTVVFLPEGQHSPSPGELASAYEKIFAFLDKL